MTKEEKKRGGEREDRGKIEKETTKGTDKDIKYQTWETNFYGAPLWIGATRIIPLGYLISFRKLQIA